MFFLLRLTIFVSLLTLWFLISYIVFDLLGVGGLDLRSKGNVEDVVAALGNYDSTRFVKELSQTYSPKQSIIGVVDSLEVRADGTVRVSGWAIDKDDSQRSLSVFMVVPNSVVLVTSTSIMREDVRIALRLSGEFKPMGFDDVFTFKLACEDKALKFFFIAVNQEKKQFALIRPPNRVSGCDDQGKGK